MKRVFAGRGVPSLLFGAWHEYRSRQRELERRGVPEDERDEIIRKECLAEISEDDAAERINLTAWAEDFEIERPVLEALVLMVWSRERAFRLPPAAAVAVPVAEPEPAAPPWTPAPPARRPGQMAVRSPTSSSP